MFPNPFISLLDDIAIIRKILLVLNVFLIHSFKTRADSTLCATSKIISGFLDTISRRPGNSMLFKPCCIAFSEICNGKFLIAAIARENRFSLLHNDGDFEIIEKYAGLKTVKV